jgi:hypothetical protein
VIVFSKVIKFSQNKRVECDFFLTPLITLSYSRGTASIGPAKELWLPPAPSLDKKYFPDISYLPKKLLYKEFHRDA